VLALCQQSQATQWQPQGAPHAYVDSPDPQARRASLQPGSREQREHAATRSLRYSRKPRLHGSDKGIPSCPPSQGKQALSSRPTRRAPERFDDKRPRRVRPLLAVYVASPSCLVVVVRFQTGARSAARVFVNGPDLGRLQVGCPDVRRKLAMVVAYNAVVECVRDTDQVVGCRRPPLRPARISQAHGVPLPLGTEGCVRRSWRASQASPGQRSLPPALVPLLAPRRRPCRADMVLNASDEICPPALLPATLPGAVPRVSFASRGCDRDR
jgi:hypothetical protein